MTHYYLQTYRSLSLVVNLFVRFLLSLFGFYTYTTAHEGTTTDSGQGREKTEAEARYRKDGRRGFFVFFLSNPSASKGLNF